MSAGTGSARGGTRQAAPWGLALLCAVLAVLGAASVWHIVPYAWSDAITLSARSQINGWQDAKPPRINLNEWGQARVRLEEGVAIAPNHAHLRSELGYVYAIRAQTLGRLPEDHPLYSLQMGLLDLAIEQYRVACALRPTFPYTWTQLAVAKHLRGQDDPELWAAFDKALQYGFADATLQPSLADIALSRWAALGVQRQQTVAAMISQAKPEYKPKLLHMVELAGVSLPS